MAQFGQCAGFGAVHYSKLPKSQQQRLICPERPGQGVGGAQLLPVCPDIARRGTLCRNVQLHVPAQSAPAGYVWANREQLRTAYTLPGAFRAYKPLLL